MRYSGERNALDRVPGFAGARRLLSALTDTLKRLKEDQGGMGAVEFALLVPMLIVVYLASFELTMGLSVNKKVSSAASTVADLVTRQKNVDKASLTAMGDVAQAIFVPYGTTGLSLKITGIKIDATSKPTVAWSWANNGVAPYAAGNAIGVPSSMVLPDTFLVHTELSVPHELLMYLPNFSGSEIKYITLGKDFYFRQRIGDGIACADC